jgi:hypothetical protein
VPPVRLLRYHLCARCGLGRQIQANDVHLEEHLGAQAGAIQVEFGVADLGRALQLYSGYFHRHGMADPDTADQSKKALQKCFHVFASRVI